MVFTFCGFKEKAEKGLSLAGLENFKIGLRDHQFCQEADFKRLLEDGNWTPGGRQTFPAQLKTPADLAPLALVFKDTFAEIIDSKAEWEKYRADFPRTQSQKDRSKVVGICCGFVKEMFADVTGADQMVVEIKYNPNRVVVKFGPNPTEAIRVNRDFTVAKITMEAATAVNKGVVVLQDQLDSWLE